MNRLIAIIVLLGLGYTIYLHERHRYDLLLYECTVQHRKDLDLLAEDTCNNLEKRLHFQHLVDCAGAERRAISAPPAQCAAQAWRAQSHIMQLWTLMTDSYWSVLGIMLPLCMWFIWLWFRERSEDKWFRLLAEKQKSHKPKKPKYHLEYFK